MSMKALCVNCLDYTDSRPVDVGPSKGSQFDPYREALVLCDPCGDALTSGDLGTFHQRYKAERSIGRADVGATGAT